MGAFRHLKHRKKRTIAVSLEMKFTIYNINQKTETYHTVHNMQVCLPSNRRHVMKMFHRASWYIGNACDLNSVSRWFDANWLT